MWYIICIILLTALVVAYLTPQGRGLICRFKGHDSGHLKNGIVRCRRCGFPILRKYT